MRRFKAFTLIETLFAIIIFCIGILAVLLWLSQTLRNQDYANTQIKAAFFAREWIELMFNLRDANYHKELPWNCIFQRVTQFKYQYTADENPFCDGIFEPWKVLKLSIWSWDEFIKSEVWVVSNNFDKDFEDFQIYFHTGSNAWFVYDYSWTEEEKTGFARYIQIESIDPWESANLDDNLLKIESHVLYKRGSLTWDKVMETFIGNYDFKQ